MPRAARVKSISGNYHVILRGINKQRIFEDDQDYQKFRWILTDVKKKYNYSLFAWCLMPNHIHLLINERQTTLSQIFREAGSRFVQWYNTKYKRTGHLFEDRFLSEPVDEESYFLTVVRYIHMNPVKAGLCIHPVEYRYSSYGYYFNNDKYADNSILFGLVEKREFEQYHQEKCEDICLDIDKLLTDKQAEAVARKVSGCERIAMVQSLPEEKRFLTIQALLRAKASVSQISRLTGIPIGIIENIAGLRTSHKI